MAVVVTFDITNYQGNDHVRLKSMFERFGWENLGGTAYRYPKLGTDDQPVEDWLNHVIPALMLFRTYLTSNPHVQLDMFTIDTNSSSGFNRETGFGSGPKAGKDAADYAPKSKAFGEKNLHDWLDSVAYPYVHDLV